MRRRGQDAPDPRAGLRTLAGLRPLAALRPLAGLRTKAGLAALAAFVALAGCGEKIVVGPQGPRLANDPAKAMEQAETAARSALEDGAERRRRAESEAQ